MATSFPTGLDALTNPVSTDALNSPSHADQHANVNDAIEALEAKVGVNGSAVTSSLDYKIANIPATSITTGTLDNARLPAAATTITSVGTLSALRVDGNFGIGGNGLAQMGLRISKAISGSAYAQGIFLDGTIQPSVTSRSDTVWSNPSVAASVTLPEINHFYASSPAIGTGSTITAVTGYKAESNLGNNYSGTVTNVYAFSGNIASGTGRWNFFANGTANNYMAGRLGVGLGLTSGAMAQVVNTTAADKAFIIRGAAAQSGDFLDVQNSGGTSQFKITSNGDTNIGTTNVYSKVNITGGLALHGATPLLNFVNASNTRLGYLYHDATNITLLNQAAGYVALGTNNTERMRIDSAGNVGIGGVPSAGRSFTLAKTMVGSIQPIGFFNSGQISTDATAGANYFNTFATTAASVATTTVTHYNTQQGTLGAGSSMVAQIGFNAADSLIGAILNYGFVGNIPSGANRYNLHMSGTAQNYLAGRLGIGAILTSGAMAQVVNTTAADKAFVVKGAASQSGDFLDVQNSGGTSQFKVDSNANLLLGTTTRRSVGGAFQTAVPNQIFIEQGSGGLTAFTSVLNRADSNGLRFVLGKSRGTAAGAVTALVDGDSIAEFHFAGADGTTLDPLAASIMVHVNGAVATGSVPGRLSFATTPVAGTNPVERMRIDSVGNVGIGAGSLAGYTLRVAKPLTGAITVGSFVANGAIQSDVTNIAYNFQSLPSIVNAAFTLGTLTHFAAGQGTKGASATLTNQIGYFVSSSLTGATNNYGFSGNIASGTNRWNLHMGGTAQNYLAGNLGIGIASPSYPLHISSGTASVDNVAMAVDVAGGNAGDSAGYVMRAANTNELGAIRSYVESSYLSNMRFFTAGATNVLTERMRIDSSGNVGIGGVPPAYAKINVGATLPSSSNLTQVFRSSGVIPSTTTSVAWGYLSALSTQAASFTLTNLLHFDVDPGAFGAGSTVTAQKGFNVSSNLTGATFNYGFYGDIASGTNRYNLFMNGNAANFLAGRLGIGATLTSGATTQITNPNASPSDKVLVVKAAPSQSGSLLEAQNSSGTALVTINSVGKVGIGNTAPENTLDITGSFGRGNPAVKTANFTLAGTENWIICNGAGTISITLPSPGDCDGREFGIKTVSPQLVQSAANNVIAIGGGAAGTAILPATSGAWAILVSDGANWNIMCRGT